MSGGDSSGANTAIPAIDGPSAGPGTPTVIIKARGPDDYLIAAMKWFGISPETPNAYSIMNPHDPRLHLDDVGWLNPDGPTDKQVKDALAAMTSPPAPSTGTGAADATGTSAARPSAPTPTPMTTLPKWVLEVESLVNTKYVGRAGSIDQFELTLPIFTCLGSSTPGTIRTNFEMLCILLRAQRWLVRACFFVNVLKVPNLKQADITAAQVREMIGPQELHSYREHGGLHATGSAIDVDAGPSPYFVSRTNSGGLYGGEDHRHALMYSTAQPVPKPIGDPNNPTNQADIDAVKKANDERAVLWASRATQALLALQKACADVCDRAYKLFYGTPADLEAETFANVTPDPGVSILPGSSVLVQTNLKAYDRIIRLHWCLRIYIAIGFRAGGVTETPERVGKKLSELRHVGGIHKDHPASSNDFGSSTPPGTPADLATFTTQLRDDCAALKFGMVIGNVKFGTASSHPKVIPYETTDPGDASKTYVLTYDDARNPRNGILSHSRLLIDAVSRVGLGWGAVEFSGKAQGAQHGDMMHFDMRCNLGEALDTPNKSQQCRANESLHPPLTTRRASDGTTNDALSPADLRDAVIAAMKAPIFPDIYEMQQSTRGLLTTLDGYKTTIAAMSPSIPQRELVRSQGEARMKATALLQTLTDIIGKTSLTDVRTAVGEIWGRGLLPGLYVDADAAVNSVKLKLKQAPSSEQASP